MYYRHSIAATVFLMSSLLTCAVRHRSFLHASGVSQTNVSSAIRSSRGSDICCCKRDKGTRRFCENPHAVMSSFTRNLSPVRTCCKIKSGNRCPLSSAYRTKADDDHRCMPVQDLLTCNSCLIGGRSWCDKDGGSCVSDAGDCQNGQLVQRSEGCDAVEGERIGALTCNSCVDEGNTWCKDGKGYCVDGGPAKCANEAAFASTINDCAGLLADARPSDGTVAARIIVGTPTIPPDALPEVDVFRRLQANGIDKLKFSSAIALEGGGFRAYTSALGVTKALHQLGLLRHLRYISAASATAWASGLFAYAEHDSMFPDVVPPNKWESKNILGENGSLGEALFKVGEGLGVSLGGTVSSEGPWPSWIIKHIFSPMGIKRNSLVAADEEHAKHLEESLKLIGKQQPILRPRLHDVPYIIVGCAVLGPKKLMPFTDEESFQHIDASSLYMGSLHSKRVQYKGTRAFKKQMLNTWHSAVIDTFAFGNSFVGKFQDWRNSLKNQRNRIEGKLRVKVTAPIDLLDIMAASSAAPAALIAMTHAVNVAISGTSREVVTISPDTRHREVHKMMFGDTGAVANIPLITLLQRKVKCTMALISPGDPIDLDWAERYVTGSVEQPRVFQIDWTLASLFGVMMVDADRKGCGKMGCALSQNHVFETDRLKELVGAFVASAKSGASLVHTMELTTIANNFWGIEAGNKVRVTFVHMGMSKSWESAAITKMRQWYKKDWDWSDFTCKSKTWQKYYGVNTSFPFGPTFPMTFYPMCRLFSAFLYQNAGDIILSNEGIIRNALEHATCVAES